MLGAKFPPGGQVRSPGAGIDLGNRFRHYLVRVEEVIGLSYVGPDRLGIRVVPAVDHENRGEIVMRGPHHEGVARSQLKHVSHPARPASPTGQGRPPRPSPAAPRPPGAPTPGYMAYK